MVSGMNIKDAHMCCHDMATSKLVVADLRSATTFYKDLQSYNTKKGTAIAIPL